MKGDLKQLLSIVTFIISYALVCVKAACPSQPFVKVNECVADMIPELSQGSLQKNEYSTRARVELAHEKCRNFKLRDVAKCIQDIMDNCQGTTDDEQTLHRLIDKDRTLNTVEYFCNNINVFERHAECISSHHEEVNECSQSARKSFQTKERAGANMDVMVTSSCRFFEVAIGCLTNTVGKFCGREAKSFVYKIMSGTQPPYCEVAYKPLATTSSYTGAAAEVTSLVSSFQIMAAILISKLCSLTLVTG